MKGDEERVRAAGAESYLSKPVDTRTLPASIASYLQRRASNSAAK
jgi:CheY-like chemotaxis protein